MTPSRLTKTWRRVALTLLCATFGCLALEESHASSDGSQPALRVDSPRDVQEQKEQRASFGLILDLDGKAIVGARLSLFSQNHGGRQTADDTLDPVGWSDEQGLAHVPPTEPGIYDLTVAADGFVALTIPGVPVDPGEGPCDLGTIWLEPGTDLVGQVIDPQGQPLAGAKLTMQHRGKRARETTEQVVTDRRGRFVFFDLSAKARLDLTVDLDGYTSRETPAVAPGDQVELVLDPVVMLSGYVLGPGGPISGAEIRLETFHQNREPVSLSVVSQADGTFELLDVAPGTLQIEVSASGFLTFVHTTEALPRQDLSDLEFVLREGKVLEGRVTSKRGPVGGVELVVRTATDAASSWPQGQSADDGHFRIAGIPPGDIEIFARHTEFPSIQRRWNVETLGEFVELELSDGVKVSGTVMGPSGEPVAEAQLHWYEIEGPEWRQVISDHDGNFVVDSLTPAQYRLRVRARGFGNVERMIEVLVSGQENMQIKLPMAGTIVGRVSGLGLEDLGSLSIRAQRHGAHRGPVQTSYEGSYRLEDLAPGLWWVRARLAGGLRELEKTVRISSTGETEVNFEFGGGLELSGQVSIDHRPAVGLRIALFSRSQAPGRIVKTDHQGRFQIAGLSPAIYRLELRHGEILEAIDLDLVDDHEVQLELTSRVPPS